MGYRRGADRELPPEGPPERGEAGIEASPSQGPPWQGPPWRTPDSQTSPLQATPERPVPEVPLRILGTGRLSPRALSGFLLRINPQAEEDFTAELAQFYTEEAEIEGVNHDVAFAQMCLETGFLRYGNLVTADMNNFCGLGAIGGEQRGERFPEPRIGVRAHIQHLKAYATDEPPRQELVDPRYRWVRYGSAPTIYGLAGTWAADRDYAGKIENILETLYYFTYTGEMPNPVVREEPEPSEAPAETTEPEVFVEFVGP
jgi:hypothetical protein